MIDYYLITKPGILFGNLITLVAGFFLAAKGPFDFGLFLVTFVGLGLIMASACVFNNYIDRDLDQKMQRTKNRALAKGLISGRNALCFATLLGVLGGAVLFLFTNGLTLAIASFGFFVYVIVYSLWKRKTIYGTAIGSIAGAVPPIVGYSAVTDRLDAGAWILFAMLVLWQMPHFFSIAIYRLEDYSKAKIPVLPVERGIYETKVRMLVYIPFFIIAAGLLTYFNYTGYLYLFVTTLLGAGWFWMALKGFKSSNDHTWAYNMFRVSLGVIMGVCFIIPFDRV